MRGPVALAAGKGLDLVTKFALQILLVHQLAQGDYGTFVYGNTLAGLFTVVIKVGQGRAIGRLVPHHQEREDPSAIVDVVRAATIIVVGSTTVFLFAIAMIFGVRGLAPTSSANSGLIVLLLLLQAPLTAVGTVAGNLLAAVASSLSVVSIAAAWLGATAAEVLYASLATLRHLHGAGSSGHIPVRSQLGWGLPVMGSDLIRIATEPLVILSLKATHGSGAVAELKVVLPLVLLSLVGAEAFTRLFYPTANRLIAKNDTVGLNRLYWQTAAWASSAALPIALLSATAAKPLVVTLFGSSYRSSAPLVRLLAIVLVPLYGVGGAAVAMARAVVTQNVLANAALKPAAGISPFPKAAIRLQATAASAIGLRWFAGAALSLGLLAGTALAAVLTLAVVGLHRRSLDITSAFPELKRSRQTP